MVGAVGGRITVHRDGGRRRRRDRGSGGPAGCERSGDTLCWWASGAGRALLVASGAGRALLVASGAGRALLVASGAGRAPPQRLWRYRRLLFAAWLIGFAAPGRCRLRVVRVPLPPRPPAGPDGLSLRRHSDTRLGSLSTQRGPHPSEAGRRSPRAGRRGGGHRGPWLPPTGGVDPLGWCERPSPTSATVAPSGTTIAAGT